MSTWLHDRVATGDELEISLPFGDLTIDPDAATPLVLISAGVGVTPMVGILEHLATRDPGRRVQVLHADRSADTHPLRARVLALVDRLDQAEIAFWYAEDTEGAHPGLLDLSAVVLPGDAEIYVCGGDGFLDAVREQLAAAGIPAERVHREQFTPTDWRR